MVIYDQYSELSLLFLIIHPQLEVNADYKFYAQLQLAPTLGPAWTYTIASKLYLFYLNRTINTRILLVSDKSHNLS